MRQVLDVELRGVHVAAHEDEPSLEHLERRTDWRTQRRALPRG